MSLLLIPPQNPALVYDEPWTMEISCSATGCRWAQTILVSPEEVRRHRGTVEQISAERFQDEGWQIEPTRCPDHAAVRA